LRDEAGENENKTFLSLKGSKKGEMIISKILGEELEVSVVGGFVKASGMIIWLVGTA